MDASLRAAVHRLLLRDGYAGVSVERVAATAGVAKTTLYRRWPSKAEMVFALVVHADTVTPPADTGTLHGDLEALTEHVVGLLAAPAARQAFPGMIADLRADPVLAARFQQTVITIQRELVGRLLERAHDRGELALVPDPADVHAQLLGTVFAWLYLMEDTVPTDLAGRISTALMATIRAGVGDSR